jgi:hypothetical protein
MTNDSLQEDHTKGDHENLHRQRTLIGTPDQTTGAQTPSTPRRPLNNSLEDPLASL